MWYIIALLIIAFLLSGIKNSLSVKKEKQIIKRELINQQKVNSYLREKELDQCRKYISRDFSNGIVFDEANNLILLITKNYQKESGEIIHNFNHISASDIMESEIVVNSTSISKISKGQQVTGALVGGVLAGGFGAVIGALSASKTSVDKVKSIQLKITVNDLNKPVHKIDCLTGEPYSEIPSKNGYSADSSEVRNAFTNIERWHAIMDVILKQQNNVDVI